MELGIVTFVDSGKSGSLYVSSVISVSHKPGKIDCKMKPEKLRYYQDEIENNTDEAWGIKSATLCLEVEKTKKKKGQNKILNLWREHIRTNPDRSISFNHLQKISFSQSLK